MGRSLSLEVAQARIVTGTLCAVGSVTYLVYAWRLPIGTLRDPGAGMFPIFVGLVALASSLWVIVDAFATRGLRERFELPLGDSLVKLLCLFGSLVFYGLSLPFIGSVAASFITAAVILKSLSNQSLVRSLAYAAIMSVSIYLVFTRLLGVPLPRGPLGF